MPSGTIFTLKSGPNPLINLIPNKLPSGYFTFKVSVLVI